MSEKEPPKEEGSEEAVGRYSSEKGDIGESLQPVTNMVVSRTVNSKVCLLFIWPPPVFVLLYKDAMWKKRF